MQLVVVGRFVDEAELAVAVILVRLGEAWRLCSNGFLVRGQKPFGTLIARSLPFGFQARFSNFGMRSKGVLHRHRYSR